MARIHIKTIAGKTFFEGQTFHSQDGKHEFQVVFVTDSKITFVSIHPGGVIGETHEATHSQVESLIRKGLI